MSILSQQKQSVNTDFPNIRPSLDLRFALAKKLDPRVTYSRGSTGTYFGSDGLMKTAGVNEPRFDHDPITGQSLGLLIEESRTNLYTRGDIDGTVGSTPTGAVVPYTSQGQSVVVSTDVFLGPNGQSAKHTKGVQQNDTNTGYFNTGVALTIGQTYCASIWLYIPPSQAKNFSGKSITFQAENSPSVTTTTARFDTTLIGVWQRAFCVFIASANNTSIICRTNAVAGSFFYTDCWQVELGAFPTSYMPASGGSQFTRSADLASMTGTNFSSWYNRNEGTIYTNNIIPYTPNPNVSMYFTVVGVSANNRISIEQTASNQLNIFNSNNATTQGFVLSPTTLPANINRKTSLSYSSSNNQLLLSATSNQLYNFNQKFRVDISKSMTGLRIGRFTDSSFFLNGTIARFTYYPIQLTNQQLINLSS